MFLEDQAPNVFELLKSECNWSVVTREVSHTNTALICCSAVAWHDCPAALPGLRASQRRFDYGAYSELRHGTLVSVTVSSCLRSSFTASSSVLLPANLELLQKFFL